MSRARIEHEVAQIAARTGIRGPRASARLSARVARRASRLSEARGQALGNPTTPPAPVPVHLVLRAYRAQVSLAAAAYDAAYRRWRELEAERRPVDPTEHRHQTAEAYRQYEATAGAYNDAQAALDQYMRTGVVSPEVARVVALTEAG